MTARLNTDQTTVNLASYGEAHSISGPKTSTLSYEFRSISADTAAAILARNRSDSDVDASVVKAYAAIMQEKAWVENAQPIVFDTEGKLLDGRKRLQACVLSGASFKTLIMNGVRKETLHTIDQHRRRQYSAVLEARGIENAAMIIRTMSKLIRIERGTFGKPFDPISWARYDQVLELNPDIMKAVQLSEFTRGCPLHSTARPVVAFMAIATGNGRLAKDLFRGMMAPEDLAEDHPARALAEQLRMEREYGQKPEVDQMIVMGIQALNDMIKGQSPKQPYGWIRDLGNCHLDSLGRPISRQQFIENTPANLGMPVVIGYEGINLGMDIQKATGEMLKKLRETTKTSHDIDLRMILLTPAVAAEWLKKFNTQNRDLQERHVEAMARDIKEGNWMMNAQPISFAGNPFTGDAILLNGQHRLKACVKADMEIEVLVATGLPTEAFATYDMHSRRNHADLEELVDDRVIAAAAKIKWKMDSGFSIFDRKTPSPAELQTTIDNSPGLFKAYPISRRKYMRSLASSGVLTFFIEHIISENHDIASRFLDDLSDKTPLSPKNPVVKMKRILFSMRGDITRNQALKILMIHWSEYMEFSISEDENAQKMIEFQTKKKEEEDIKKALERERAAGLKTIDEILDNGQIPFWF